MPYHVQYGLAVATATALAMIAALQLADPATLGISPMVIAWAAIITPGLGILAGVLPNLREPPRDNVLPPH